MEYQCWKYRDNTLIVEKLIGEFKKSDILESDKQLLVGSPKKEDIIIITDITEATFPSLQMDEINSLIDNLAQHAKKINSLKIALIANPQFYEDFDKAYNYSYQASKKNFVAQQFLYVDSALDWVEVTFEERQSILKHLNRTDTHLV